MRITGVTPYVHAKEKLLFVKVDTDTGVSGWGECSPMKVPVIVSYLKECVIPVALGREAHDVEDIILSVLRGAYKINGQALWIALSGMEIALWDIIGRSAQVPVYKLLGGAVRKRIPVYASSMRRDITPAEEADRMERLVGEKGFSAVKVKIGKRYGFDEDETPGRTVGVVAEVRRRLGDGIEIMVDANSCYSASKAIRMGRELEQYGIFHFEEPCPYLDIDAHAEVARALDTPVALGEQEWNPLVFKEMLVKKAADIIQPDIVKAGGFSQMKKLAALAEAFGAVMTPHQTKAFGTVINLHLAASTPCVRYYQEYSIESPHLRDEIFRNYPAVVDGHMSVPEEPGLGLEFRDEFLERLIPC